MVTPFIRAACAAMTARAPVVRCREFDWLLDDGRWKQVGPGYDDIHGFLATIDLSAFRLDDKKKIAGKLADLKAKQEASAKALGVSQGTVSKWASGKSYSEEYPAAYVGPSDQDEDGSTERADIPGNNDQSAEFPRKWRKHRKQKKPVIGVRAYRHEREKSDIRSDGSTGDRFSPNSSTPSIQSPTTGRYCAIRRNQYRSCSSSFAPFCKAGLVCWLRGDVQGTAVALRMRRPSAGWSSRAMCWLARWSRSRGPRAVVRHPQRQVARHPVSSQYLRTLQGVHVSVMSWPE